jgi:hypothetical protein
MTRSSLPHKNTVRCTQEQLCPSLGMHMDKDAACGLALALVSAPRIPKVHLWFTGSAEQGNLPTAAKWNRVACPPLQTWLVVLLSDLSWFYPGGQCHSCCGERAHV